MKKPIKSGGGSAFEVTINCPALVTYEGKIEKITDHSVTIRYKKHRSKSWLSREVPFDENFVYLEQGEKKDSVSVMSSKEWEATIPKGKLTWLENKMVKVSPDKGEYIVNPKFADMISEVAPPSNSLKKKKVEIEEDDDDDDEDEKPTVKKAKKFGRRRETDDWD